MIQRTDYKLFVRSIALSILIILLSFYLSLRQTTAANATSFWVVHTQEVLLQTEKLYFFAINLETGARAFMLTGQPSFLETYKASATSAHHQVHLLERLMADNPAQRRRLDALHQIITQRITFYDSVVTLKEDIDLNRSLEIVKTGNTNAYIEDVKRVNADLQNEENRLLLIRTAASEKAIKLQHQVFVYCIAAMMLLLTGIFLMQKRLSAKKKREQSDAVFRNLIESAPDAIIITNDKDRIVLVNHATELLFKYNSQDLADTLIQSLIPDYLHLDNVNMFSEFTAVNREGRSFPVEVSAAPVQTGEGTLISVTIRDIASRMLAAEKLRQSEEFFRVMVQNVKEYAIFMVDLNGRIVSWNQGAQNIKGYREDEIIGQSIELFYTQEDVIAGEPMRNLAMASQLGHFEKEGRRVRKDGTSFWADVVFTALKDKAGNTYSYCKITRDITDRRNIQAKLELLFRQINQSNDAIYTVDAHLRLQSWNRGAENLYGYKQEEVLGKNPNQLLQTVMSPAEVAGVLQVIGTADYWTGELKRVTKSGKAIIVRASSTSVVDENGDISGYVSSNYDITEQKAMVKELNHLANIVAQSSEAIFSRDSAYRIVSWNRGAEVLFGINREDAIDKSVQELGFLKMTNEELSGRHAHLAKEGTVKTESYFSHKDGTVFFGSVTGNVTKDDNGEISSYNFIVKDITERKQLEEQLQSSNEMLERRVQERAHEIYKNEQRYRILVENNYDIIMVTDLSGCIQYRSPSVTRILGFDNDSNTELETIENIHPDDRAYAIQLTQQVLLYPGESVKSLLRRQHKNGHYVWLEGVVTNLLNDERINGIVSNFRDVTEQIVANDRLTNNEKRFRTLIEKNKDVIMLFDASFKVIYKSPSAKAIMGLTEDDVDLILDSQNIHPSDLDYAQIRITEMLNNPGKPIQVQFRIGHKSGTYRWLDGVVTNLLEEQSVSAILFNFRDFTDRVEAEEKLASSEIRFRSLIENISDAIVVNDEQSTILYQSPSVAKILGYGPEDRIGNKVMNYIHPDNVHDFQLLYDRLKSTQGVPLPFQYRFLHKNGNYIWLEGVVTNLTATPAVKGYVANYRDITERKMAEDHLSKLNAELEERVLSRTEQLRKSNQELEAFSYSVSHDLRAPLRAISGFTSKLEEKYSSRLDEEALRITGVIKNNTKKMGLLIDDLLGFSRMGRQELVKIKIDCNFMVQEIIDGYQRDAPTHIQWKKAALPAVYADAATLRQVWINLISNAVKYSSKTPNPVIEIGTSQTDYFIVFYVKDNGIGFNEKYKDKLFKVFQRLHSAEEFDGTGVGLAIVEKIISKHGGDVWVEAAENKGACFSFSIPCNVAL